MFSDGFILQATRVLLVGNYSEEELSMIFNFITLLDDKTISGYINQKCSMIHDNDIELYIEIAENLISVFEDQEEYEKCHALKIKRDFAHNILKQQQ